MHTNTFEEPSEAALPCAGGLLAGTLALMTCWAAPERSAHASEEHQRLLMARKIASNLFFLREHPDVGAGMRQVIGKAHERWVLLAHALPAHGPDKVELTQPEFDSISSALH
jgi:hypothetical protein